MHLRKNVTSTSRVTTSSIQEMLLEASGGGSGRECSGNGGGGVHSTFSTLKMWWWALLWQASALLAVSGTLDFGFFNQRRQFMATPQINCFEYSFNSNGFGKAQEKGLRAQRKMNSFKANTVTVAPTFPTDPLLNINEISKRIDHLLPEGNDIVKEHAKLVQDINSLRQIVFVAPLAGEDRDYEDSIFHEIIETSTTTTPKPTTTKPMRSVATKPIPVILLGGASQRQLVKSQPIKFPAMTQIKPTISLVGTSISPLLKHPYPFVIQESPKKPVKVCMTSMPIMYPTTTKRPSLWQRLLNTLIPR